MNCGSQTNHGPSAQIALKLHRSYSEDSVHFVVRGLVYEG